MDLQKLGAVVVSIIVTAGFVGLLTLWLLRPSAIAVSELLVSMVGVLGANFTTVVQYWLGSSSSSKGKDETIAKLSEDKKGGG